MTIDEILALTKAGFTKDDIMKLGAGLDLESKENNENDEPSETRSEKPKSDPQDPASAKEDKIDDVIAKLEKLSSGIESIALKSTQMPERETADDALARIINPYLTNGTGGN